MRPELVLASSSPRRQELLALLGVDFQIKTSEVDESIAQGTLPGQMVEELARRKASKVAEFYHDALIIGADTVVVIDGQVLGKPRDANDAKAMLHRINGRAHEVYSGIALVHKKEGNVDRMLTCHRVTKVWMRSMTPHKIDWYVETKEPLDKAGAYGIQGLGSCLVDKIEGCYFNVVGMSLSLLDQMMEELGFSLAQDFSKKK